MRATREGMGRWVIGNDRKNGGQNKGRFSKEKRKIKSSGFRKEFREMRKTRPKKVGRCYV